MTDVNKPPGELNPEEAKEQMALRKIIQDPYEKFQADGPRVDITMGQRREKLLSKEPSAGGIAPGLTALPNIGDDSEGPRKTRVFKDRAMQIIHGEKPESKDRPRDNLLIIPRSQKDPQEDSADVGARMDKILSKNPSTKHLAYADDSILLDEDLRPEGR